MAAFDYSAAASTAAALIAKFGESATFVKKSESDGGYDQFGNLVAAGADANYDGVITPLLDFNSVTMRPYMEKNGDQIKRGDKWCFFDSENQVPIDSVVNINSINWRVRALMKEISSISGTNVFRAYHLTR